MSGERNSYPVDDHVFLLRATETQTIIYESHSRGIFVGLEKVFILDKGPGASFTKLLNSPNIGMSYERIYEGSRNRNDKEGIGYNAASVVSKNIHCVRKSLKLIDPTIADCIVSLPNGDRGYVYVPHESVEEWYKGGYEMLGPVEKSFFLTFNPLLIKFPSDK